MMRASWREGDRIRTVEFTVMGESLVPLKWDERPMSDRERAKPAAPADEPCEGCGSSVFTKMARGLLQLVRPDKRRAMASSRWATCSHCRENDLGVCRKCSCVLAAKVWLKRERCPIGKW